MECGRGWRPLLALLAITLPVATYAHPDPAPAGRAEIVVYRTAGFVGSLVGHVVEVNGQRAAKLRPKNVTVLSVPAGTTTVCIFGKYLCVDAFEARAGERYFIRDTSDPKVGTEGAHFMDFYLARVDARVGEPQSSGLKPVAAEAAFRQATPTVPQDQNGTSIVRGAVGASSTAAER